MDKHPLHLPLPAQLPDDLAALKALLSGQQTLLTMRQERIAELELANLLLNHRLAMALKQCYGPRADKVAGGMGQMLLEFAASLEAKPIVAQDLPPGTDPATATRRVGTERPGSPGRGRRNLALRDDLPVLEHVHDLPADQIACPSCRGARVKIGEETTWQLGLRPAFFFRHKHVQFRYACRSCDTQAENPQIVLAAVPAH